MNNTIGMNGNVRYESKYAKRTPAWLVLIAQFILWLTNVETVKVIRAGAALLVVVLVAAFAAGIGSGSVPLVYGIIITAALSAVALMLTRDLD